MRLVRQKISNLKLAQKHILILRFTANIIDSQEGDNLCMFLNNEFVMFYMFSYSTHFSFIFFLSIFCVNSNTSCSGKTVPIR